MRKPTSPTTIPLSTPTVLLSCAHPAHLCTDPPRHSIPIGPASAATTVGFVQTPLSKPRRSIVPTHTFSSKRDSDKALTFVASDGHLSDYANNQEPWVGIAVNRLFRRELVFRSGSSMAV